MIHIEQAAEALQAARAMRDGLPHGTERSAVNAVLDRLDVAIAALSAQQAAQPVAGEPDGWEANASYLLDRCPYTIRVREGGGPESLLSSLVVTFQGMQAQLSARIAAPAPVGLVPLTPSEKRRMWHSATDLHRAVSHFESYCQGIEDGEAHHGIKAGKDGAHG